MLRLNIVTRAPQPPKPQPSAPAQEWRAYFWDWAEADTALSDGNRWAAALLPLLRSDPDLGRFYPVFSMWVMRLATNRPDLSASGMDFVASARHDIASDNLFVYAPANGEVFDPWGGFIPWHPARSPEHAVEMLRYGVATRHTRPRPTYAWTIADHAGPILDLTVARLDFSGLLDTMNVRRPHALAKAIADTAATSLARPKLADIPETWPKVQSGALKDVQIRGHLGDLIDAIEIRAHGSAVWWTGTPQV